LEHVSFRGVFDLRLEVFDEINFGKKSVKTNVNTFQAGLCDNETMNGGVTRVV